MGIDAARFRNDGALGLAIGNFANEMTALYVVAARARCSSPTRPFQSGVGPASRRSLKFGVFFFDYDLDGRLDLLTANGHLEDEITKVQASQQYAQPAQLFWNAGARGGAARSSRSRRRNRRDLSGRSSAAAAPSPTSTATATSTSC